MCLDGPCSSRAVVAASVPPARHLAAERLQVGVLGQRKEPLEQVTLEVGGRATAAGVAHRGYARRLGALPRWVTSMVTGAVLVVAGGA